MTPHNPDNLYLETLLGSHPHSSSPYLETITFLYNDYSSSPYLHHHFANKAQFINSRFLNPKPPANFGLITSFQFIKCIFFLLLLPSHRKFLLIRSNLFLIDAGIQ
eukprot:TRINITY_DN10664_c0_g1_i1.p1 TRINITY_DN10664_c0_g1~~TRINITY_DN10664_c0_g1_i1.p1  ORF type:complete len:106 (-),score=0.90 TRINITY_DN10664_c0_g1_i1:1553-1870(-)